MASTPPNSEWVVYTTWDGIVHSEKNPAYKQYHIISEQVSELEYAETDLGVPDNECLCIMMEIVFGMNVGGCVANQKEKAETMLAERAAKATPAGSASEPQPTRPPCSPPTLVD